jgi:hypothetical protein
MRVAKREGLESVTGVEFYGKIDGVNTHLTALDFDPTEPGFRAFVDKRKEIYSEGTRLCFERGVRLGIIQGVTWQDVLDANEGVAWFCNEQVFRTMVAKGLAKPEEYEEWVDKIWYYHEHLAPIPPAYPFKDAQGIIDLVHAAGGIILIAHPHKQLHFIDRLVAMGLDGIEVYHPDLLPEEQTEAMRIAYEKNLFIAGGTDHSGVLGGEYISFKNPEECPYYLEPRVFGTMEEHFRELKERKIGKREYKHTHTARRGKYL